MKGIKEACGVVGIYSCQRDDDIGKKIFYGLYALQHRGQESAGIAVSTETGIKYHKDLGLVSEIFNDEILDGLVGKVGIGHVRYAAGEANTQNNVQPLVARYKNGQLAIAHNGNLINASEIRKELEDEGAVFQTQIDSEVIACLIARQQTSDMVKALKSCMQRIKGSYAIVIMTQKSLIGMRDPYGIRPLCIGKLERSYILASESCALDTIGAKFIRDVEPGEIVIIDKSGVRSIKNEKVTNCGHCIFEFVYFARPDSTIDGQNVYKARYEAGRQLALEHPADADMVVGVPDSGSIAAMGYSDASGIPFGIGLIKNRYVGRTFIKATQVSRAMGVKIKLNAVSKAVKGKRIVMVDDSIVRGTTSGLIVNLLREAGASQVHVRISSPPVKNSCYFGIDTSSRKELIGARWDLEKIREFIGADSLKYLSLGGLIKASGNLTGKYCTGCFNGKYPMEVPKEGRRYLYEKR